MYTLEDLDLAKVLHRIEHLCRPLNPDAHAIELKLRTSLNEKYQNIAEHKVTLDKFRGFL